MSKSFRNYLKRKARAIQAKISSQDPSGKFLFKDGRVMAILRPENVELKLSGVRKIPTGTPHEIAQPMFDGLLSEQPHQFIGYAAKGSADILDEWGNVIDSLKAGDSFVGCGDGTDFKPPAFMLTGKFHKEVWDGRTVVVLPNPTLTGDSNTGIVVGDSPDRGSIITRGGITEPDCHIPTLNRIWTGDPERHWTRAKETNK